MRASALKQRKIAISIPEDPNVFGRNILYYIVQYMYVYIDR